jgi:hypothetical protein
MARRPTNLELLTCLGYALAVVLFAGFLLAFGWWFGPRLVGP